MVNVKNGYTEVRIVIKNLIGSVSHTHFKILLDNVQLITVQVYLRVLSEILLTDHSTLPRILIPAENARKRTPHQCDAADHFTLSDSYYSPYASHHIAKHIYQ